MNSIRQLVVLAMIWLASCATANAAIIHYDFNFSSSGTGSFDFDDASNVVRELVFDFGSLGNLPATDLGAFLTPLVLGVPPGPAVVRDNTFFRLHGGAAHSVRLNTNGTWCVRQNAGRCESNGRSNMASGTYLIAQAAPGSVVAVAEPDMLALVIVGLVALAFVRLRVSRASTTRLKR